MKASTFHIGLASTVVLLTLAPVTQAFPQWMKPRSEESKNAPRQYNVYEPPPQYGGYYTYAGNGPRPTIASSSSSSISYATSEVSGEETSSSVASSGKLFPISPKLQISFFAQFLQLSLPLKL